MKQHALAFAIVAAAAPALALADGPTLYGKINLTLDQVQTDNAAPAADTTVWALNNNASRIGVKGEADTGIQGVKGLYVAEFGVKADDGVGPFTARNIYAGVKGDFGTLIAGNVDTPLKSSQGSFDEFNDLAADITKILPGETRAANTVAYSTPKFADAVTVTVAIVPAEGADIDNADSDATPGTGVEDGIADILSTSIVYQKGAIYAALALDRNSPGTGNVDGFTDVDSVTTGSQSFADITRAVFQYRADAFEAGVLYQTADDVSNGSSKSDAAWVLSGAYKADKWKFKAQYGSGEGDVSKKKKTLAALGADYALGKSTTVFGYYADVSTDVTGPADTALTTIGLGIDQKF